MKKQRVLQVLVFGAVTAGRLIAADRTGNTASGFGGAIGQGSLTLTDDGATITATAFTTDQRGSERVTGPFPDIGAVEAFPFSLLVLVDADGDGIDDRLFRSQFSETSRVK